MKTVKVQPAPGGWTVECDLGPMPLAFLNAEAACLKAEELGGLYAGHGQLTRVLVEDDHGGISSATVIGPSLPARHR
jgi:hypothetical protein